MPRLLCSRWKLGTNAVYRRSGDATEEDMESAKAYERQQYIEKKREKEQREYELRQYRPRAKIQQTMAETIEVVE